MNRNAADRRQAVSVFIIGGNLSGSHFDLTWRLGPPLVLTTPHGQGWPRKAAARLRATSSDITGAIRSGKRSKRPLYARR
jgi:hypothetical protein